MHSPRRPAAAVSPLPPSPILPCHVTPFPLPSPAAPRFAPYLLIQNRVVGTKLCCYCRKGVVVVFFVGYFSCGLGWSLLIMWGVIVLGFCDILEDQL